MKLGFSGPPEKKRRVTVKTAEKWIRENDKEHNTATWLEFEKHDRDYMRNFNPAYIVGSKNQKASVLKNTQQQICTSEHFFSTGRVTRQRAGIRTYRKGA